MPDGLGCDPCDPGTGRSVAARWRAADLTEGRGAATVGFEFLGEDELHDAGMEVAMSRHLMFGGHDLLDQATETGSR